MPVDYDADRFTQAVHNQNFSKNISFQDFKNKFTPLLKTGPREDKLTQWIVEIGREVRQMIPGTDRIYIQWQTCKVKPFTIQGFTIHDAINVSDMDTLLRVVRKKTPLPKRMPRKGMGLQMRKLHKR